MKITPREGDYVRTAGLTEANHCALINTFIDCGFLAGESTRGYSANYFECIGIINGKIHYSDSRNRYKRELSLSDLLGDEAVVWDGEGLPPVGAECEFFYIESLAGVWQTCTIDFIGNNIVVLTTEIASEISVFKETIKFRPIKSEREISIEEMTRFLQSPKRADTTLAEDLYDFGFRIIKDAEE